MILGIAVTEHCNLRCPHCIRDDVTTVRNLDPELIFRTVDDARQLFDTLGVSMTGGEPTIHPRWDHIVAGLHERGVDYRFVTNGWHMRRLMPGLDRHPPAHVRVSLSGADEAVHDAERGRGSFKRVLLAVALLTSRRISTSLGLVVDRRDRHQVRMAADLAEALGCVSINYSLAQPVPGSAARDSDMAPHEWYGARDEIIALSREGRRTGVYLDYGFPFDGPETSCDTFSHKRLYIDARGRLSLCCQLSEYGENENDVVADLNELRFREAWPRYVARLDELGRASAALAAAGGEHNKFPCIRCARALGKMEWVRDYPDSPWHGAAGGATLTAPVPLVKLHYRKPELAGV